jgi:molecular chaperone DnaK
MIKEAELHKAEDQKRKELVDVKNSADALIHQTDKSMTELGEKVDSNTKKEIDDAIAKLKEVINNPSSTKDQIEVETRNLSSVAQKLATAGSEAGNSGTKPKNDDTIDAEVV